MPKEFPRFHPIISFLYFISVIGLSMFLRNPVCIMTGFLSATVYSVILNGKRAVKASISFLLPMMLLITIINPFFSHQGITVLWYFKNGNAFTLEACVYGLFGAFLLATVIQWFSCVHRIMTEEKVIYIFGRVFPAMSLVISMVFRFVPRYRIQIQETLNAQKQLGKQGQGKNVITKMRNGIRMLSGMLTWALEHAVETAQSMKNRGYGLEKRTSYSLFHWEVRDTSMLIVILVLTAGVIYAAYEGIFAWSCYPTFLGAFMNNYPGMTWKGWMWIAYVAYAILTTLPILTDISSYIYSGRIKRVIQ